MSATVPVTDRLGLLQISGESVFNTANVTDLTYVRCVGAPDRSGLTEDGVTNDSQRQQFFSNDPIITVKNGTITTRHYLHGASSTKPVGALAHNSPEAGSGTGFDMLIGAIASAFGNIISGGYIASINLATAPSTTTVLKEADLSSFGIGQMVTWGTAAGSAFESGWVKNNVADTTDLMTLLFAADATPTGDTVYGSHTIFVKAGQPYLDATPEAFTIRYTDQGGNQLTCTGCAVTGLSISANHKEPAMLDLTWGVASWSETETGTAPAAGSYVFPEPEAVTGAAVVWGEDAATDTRIVQSLQFDLGLTRQAVEDYNQTDGIADWVTTNIEPKLTFSVYRDSTIEVTDYSANSTSPFSVIFGSQPGKMIGLCFPSAIITALPTPASGDLITASVELVPGENTTDTGTPTDTTAIGTVCRLAFG